MGVDSDIDRFCAGVYTYYPASDYLPGVFGNIGIGGLIVGIFYFFSAALTIIWIRQQQQNALRGMEGAAKHVVFPIYLPIMWTSAISDALVGLVIFFVPVNPQSSNPWQNAAAVAAALGIQHFVLEGIAFVLLQYGCGVRALRVSALCGGFVGIMTFLFCFFFFYDGANRLFCTFYFVGTFMLLLFYATIWVAPEQRLFRRPAIIFYAKFWTLFQALTVLSVGLVTFFHMYPDAVGVGKCLANLGAIPLFLIFKPIVMYTTLLMESKWWQGLALYPVAAAVREGRGGGGGGGGPSTNTSAANSRMLSNTRTTTVLASSADYNNNNNKYNNIRRRRKKTRSSRSVQGGGWNGSWLSGMKGFNSKSDPCTASANTHGHHTSSGSSSNSISSNYTQTMSYGVAAAGGSTGGSTGGGNTLTALAYKPPSAATVRKEGHEKEDGVLYAGETSGSDNSSNSTVIRDVTAAAAAHRDRDRRAAAAGSKHSSWSGSGSGKRYGAGGEGRIGFGTGAEEDDDDDDDAEFYGDGLRGGGGGQEEEFSGSTIYSSDEDEEGTGDSSSTERAGGRGGGTAGWMRVLCAPCCRTGDRSSNRSNRSSGDSSSASGSGKQSAGAGRYKKHLRAYDNIPTSASGGHHPHHPHHQHQHQHASSSSSRSAFVSAFSWFPPRHRYQPVSQQATTTTAGSAIGSDDNDGEEEGEEHSLDTALLAAAGVAGGGAGKAGFSASGIDTSNTRSYRKDAFKRQHQQQQQGDHHQHHQHQQQQQQQQQQPQQLRDPLLGIEVGFSEAQELAQEIDNMAAPGNAVKLLNFAYLSLDSGGSTATSSNSTARGGSVSQPQQQQKLLGAGSFSKVYAGRYRGVPVAVKMLFTQDLNPDVIKRCCNEARILAEVCPHPHVVNIFGVAVLPPSVCLVLEICEFGSLADVLRGSQDGGGGGAAGSGSGSPLRSRPPLHLCFADRMYLALGCARGLQALHDHSSMLCHRDIKSYNFLIDSQLNAKIADLDLGHEYDRPTDAAAGGGGSEGVEEDALPPVGEESMYMDVAGDIEGGRAAAGRRLGGGRGRGGRGREPPAAGASSSLKNPAKVGGSNMCIYWQAPEVLLGQQYTQKSDIFSFTLVLWEIISAGKVVKFFTNNNGQNKSLGASSFGSTSSGSIVSGGGGGGNSSSSQPHLSQSISYGTTPYAECNNMREVREKIVRGQRPLIPPAIGSAGAVKVTSGGLARAPDALLLELLQSGWHPEPQCRPGVHVVVEALTRCWRNSLHSTLLETPYLVDVSKIQEENFRLTVLQEYGGGGGGYGGSANNNNENSTATAHSRGGMNSNVFRASSITMASSFFTPNNKNSNNGSGSNGSSSLSAATGRGAYSPMQRASVVGGGSRRPPSPEVIASLLLMRREAAWSKLEDEGAFLILTPQRPFFMLWATRKWTQLTGYLVNDVIAVDIFTLLGPKTDHAAFDLLLHAVGATGKTEHIVSTIYRRDGKPLTLSIHLFPVFDATPSSSAAAAVADAHAAMTAPAVSTPAHMHVRSATAELVPNSALSEKHEEKEQEEGENDEEEEERRRRRNFKAPPSTPLAQKPNSVTTTGTAGAAGESPFPQSDPSSAAASAPDPSGAAVTAEDEGEDLLLRSSPPPPSPSPSCASRAESLSTQSNSNSNADSFRYSLLANSFNNITGSLVAPPAAAAAAAAAGLTVGTATLPPEQKQGEQDSPTMKSFLKIDTSVAGDQHIRDIAINSSDRKSQGISNKTSLGSNGRGGGGALEFRGRAIEDECVSRNVAYIAVQFSSMQSI